MIIKSKLTPRQKLAVQSLAAGQTILQTAVAANVARETVYKWMQQPEFNQAVIRTTDAALDILSRRLVEIGELAVNTLEAAMNDPEAPHSVKIRAAEIVLTRLLNMRELVDLENRIFELEKVQNDKH